MTVSLLFYVMHSFCLIIISSIRSPRLIIAILLKIFRSITENNLEVIKFNQIFSIKFTKQKNFPFQCLLNTFVLDGQNAKTIPVQ